MCTRHLGALTITLSIRISDKVSNSEIGTRSIYTTRWLSGKGGSYGLSIAFHQPACRGYRQLAGANFSRLVWLPRAPPRKGAIALVISSAPRLGGPAAAPGAAPELARWHPQGQMAEPRCHPPVPLIRINLTHMKRCASDHDRARIAKHVVRAYANFVTQQESLKCYGLSSLLTKAMGCPNGSNIFPRINGTWRNLSTNPLY